MKRLLITLLIALFLLTSCGKDEVPTEVLPAEVISAEVISAIEAEVAEEHGLDVACVMMLEARYLRDGYYLVELIAQAEDYHLLTYVMSIDDDGDSVVISDWQVKGGE